MIERRLVGRRFIDFHREAAHPLYPHELERRLAKRRVGDRDGTPGGIDALMPGHRRRPPILWRGVARCQNCGRELNYARNLSNDGRKYFIVESILDEPTKRACECENARVEIEWIAQAGRE